jgi:hypothetical protein
MLSEENHRRINPSLHRSPTCSESLMARIPSTMSNELCKYRLLADVRIDGIRYRVGAVIERPAEWRGPMRAMRTEPHTYGTLLGGTHEDVPLYVKLDD